MQRFRSACPPEFRQQLVELVRSGRTPEELSHAFEPTAHPVMNWVLQAKLDARKSRDR
jgi:transposase